MKVITHPTPGLFKRRMVKGGPWLPVKLFLDHAVDDEGCRADRAPMLCMWTPEATTHHRGHILDVWPGLHPVSAAEFDLLCRGPLVHRGREKAALHEQAPLF